MFSEILTPCLYAGTLAGALCLLVGLLAWQLPFLELANDYRLFALAGTGVLLAISITISDRRLMLIDAVVFAATLLLSLCCRSRWQLERRKTKRGSSDL